MARQANDKAPYREPVLTSRLQYWEKIRKDFVLGLKCIITFQENDQRNYLKNDDKVSVQYFFNKDSPEYYTIFEGTFKQENIEIIKNDEEDLWEEFSYKIGSIQSCFPLSLESAILFWIFSLIDGQSDPFKFRKEGLDKKIEESNKSLSLKSLIENPVIGNGLKNHLAIEVKEIFFHDESFQNIEIYGQRKILTPNEAKIIKYIYSQGSAGFLNKTPISLKETKGSLVQF